MVIASMSTTIPATGYTYKKCNPSGAWTKRSDKTISQVWVTKWYRDFWNIVDSTRNQSYD